MAPIVADVDVDGRPEILLFDNDVGLQVFDGDCSTVFTKAVAAAGTAVGDLDGDGVPEIVSCCTPWGQPRVLDNKGNLLATVPQGNPLPILAVPIIADLDGSSPPEIVYASEVLRYQKGKPDLAVVWQKPPNLQMFGEAITIAADLDGDGRAEVIVGARIYDGVTGADKTPVELGKLAGDGAYAAVGDFNGDQKPDLVLAQVHNGREQVSVYDYSRDRFLLGPYERPISQVGPPTVADYDGDGQPEFAVSTTTSIQVYDLECAVADPPGKCSAAGFGELWEKPIMDNSGVLGSSAFDFDGDGAAEVVHRDMCRLRTYDGRSGRVLFAASVTSYTAWELPVVADVDGDGHAEIVVSSDDEANWPDGAARCPGTPEPETGTPWTGSTHGVLVFADPYRRWMPARPVWNQHAYHGTNINDDLSVPIPEKASWLASNTYRAQSSPGTRGPLPDFTAAPEPAGVDPGSTACATAWTLRAQVCNRGAVAAAAPVPATFYASDPRKPPATPLCTATTRTTLAPRSCETVACDWKSPPMGMADLWFRADDDGAGKPKVPVPECKETNDLALLPGSICTPSTNR